MNRIDSKFCHLQQEISADRLRQKVGREIHVIIDQANENDAIGRSEGDSPEIDGKVLLSDGNFLVGDIVRARVESAGPYDLWATCSL